MWCFRWSQLLFLYVSVWVCTCRCRSGAEFMSCKKKKKKSQECLNKISLYQNVFILDKPLWLGDHPVSKNKSPLDGAIAWFMLFWKSPNGTKKKTGGKPDEAEVSEWSLCVFLLVQRYNSRETLTQDLHTNTTRHLVAISPLKWLPLASFARSLFYSQEMPEVQGSTWWRCGPVM